jgi:hypothetical protein
MRRVVGIVALALALGLVACESHSVAVPISPSALQTATPLPLLTPGAVGHEQWILTSTYIGHAGPEACISPFSGTAGKPIDGGLGIQRDGESIHFLTEHDHYIGTLIADEFSATETQDPGGMWDCGAERRPFRFEGSVSGRFSADGRMLAGEEVALFRFSTGETISRRWHWIAARK